MKFCLPHFYRITASSLLAAGALIFFNGCAETQFSSATGVNSQGCPGPQCEQTCYGQTCEPAPESLRPVTKTETFHTGAPKNKADILLVIDTSESMLADITKLEQRMYGFVQDLEFRGIDWQMCYTTAHVGQHSLGGKAMTWMQPSGSQIQSTGKKVLKKGQSNTANIFEATMRYMKSLAAQQGSGTEQSIIAANHLVSYSSNANCHRSDAALAVVLLSDEDEKSCGGRCWGHEQYQALEEEDNPQYLIDLVAQKWSHKPFTVHSIVIKKDDAHCFDKQNATFPAFYGVEYSKLSRKTGGTIGSVCEPSYSQQLQAIEGRIAESLDSLTLSCEATELVAVKFSPAVNNVDISFSGDKVFFDPGLPGGVEVKVTRTCLQ